MDIYNQLFIRLLKIDNIKIYESKTYIRNVMRPHEHTRLTHSAGHIWTQNNPIRPHRPPCLTHSTPPKKAFVVDKGFIVKYLYWVAISLIHMKQNHDTQTNANSSKQRARGK